MRFIALVTIGLGNRATTIGSPLNGIDIGSTEFPPVSMRKECRSPGPPR